MNNKAVTMSSCSIWNLLWKRLSKNTQFSLVKIKEMRADDYSQ